VTRRDPETQNVFNSIFSDNEGGNSPPSFFLPVGSGWSARFVGTSRAKRTVLFSAGRIKNFMKKWLKIWRFQKLMRLALLD